MLLGTAALWQLWATQQQNKISPKYGRRKMSNSQAVADDGLRLTGTIKSIAMAITQPRMPSNALMVAQLKNIVNPPCDPRLLGIMSPYCSHSMYLFSTQCLRPPQRIEHFSQSGHGTQSNVLRASNWINIHSIYPWEEKHTLRIYHF